MTNNNVLYFPFINVPKSDWTIRSILYWDKVGSIVPQSFLYEPSQFSSEMRELVAQELIEILQPHRYDRYFYKFEEEFITELTRDPKFIDRAKRNYKEGKVTRIHFDKMIHTLFYRFKELGIGNWKGNDWHWFYLEKNVANLYMCFLATTIGKVSNYTPATDNKNNIINSYFLKKEQREQIRQHILEDIIPTPQDVDLKKLRKFKDKYSEDLIRFRRTVEDSILSISNLSPEDYSEAIKLKVEEINDKKNQILFHLNQSGFKRIGLGNFLLVAGSGTAFFLDGGIISGGVFLGSVYNAIENSRNKFENDNFAYIAHYEKKLLGRR